MVFTKIAISGLVLASASALPSSGEQDIYTGVENVIEQFRRRLADSQSQRPKCSNMEVTKIVLNASSCDDLENTPPEFEECSIAGVEEMTGKEAMMYNAIYCKTEFDDSIEAYRKAMLEDMQGGGEEGQQDGGEEEDQACTKEQLKKVQTTLTDVNNCKDLFKMFANLGDGNAEFFCDEMEEIGEDMGLDNPSDCTDSSVGQLKERVQKAMAKADNPRGQLGSGEPSDSKESAAPRRGSTTTEAIFASLVASVFFAALLL